MDFGRISVKLCWHFVAAPPSETAQGEKHARNVRPISLLLVPRVRAASAEALESQVERAYRDAYGASLEVVFVRAETLAHANGSLRCIACPVPDGALPALADSTFGGN